MWLPPAGHTGGEPSRQPNPETNPTAERQTPLLVVCPSGQDTSFTCRRTNSNTQDTTNPKAAPPPRQPPPTSGGSPWPVYRGKGVHTRFGEGEPVRTDRSQDLYTTG